MSDNLTPEEILAILNEHGHDGGSDWEHLLVAGAYYARFARVQVMSSATAQIVADHYRRLEK